MFVKRWESIVGNADEFLYLGGNERAYAKWILFYLKNIFIKILQVLLTN